MDGSVDRDTPDELSFSAIVITVYFIWGVVFLPDKTEIRRFDEKTEKLYPRIENEKH